MKVNNDPENPPVKLLWQAKILLALWLVVRKKNPEDGVRFNFWNPLSYLVLLIIALASGLLDGLISAFKLAYKIAAEVIKDALTDIKS